MAHSVTDSWRWFGLALLVALAIAPAARGVDELAPAKAEGPADKAEGPKDAEPKAKPEQPKVTADEPQTKPDGAPAAAEPKLRFNFRFQRWADVLEWFAQQADMSLVIDAPPPGTLNYSDDREYGVADAIDLLNGVLLTKGYTLVRRDRMLIVVNLADGIPESLVPRVKLEDLDKRGKFEVVSVLFTLGNRDVDDVVKEIAPLLGPRGKSSPLPKTKQLLVTETAGVMRAIDTVIQSIPEPSKPAASNDEKPQLVVYPLKSADPEAVVKVLESLMPTGRFVRDPKANQVSAYATPSQQDAVQSVINQMQTVEGPPERQSRFEVYPIDEGDAKQTLAALQPLVPNARLSMDPASKKLAAWGTAADHDILKKAVAQLAPGAGGAVDDRQVEIYRLTKADPVAVQTMLQALVPRARMTIDTPTRSLIALASLADQKTIRATLDQLEPGKRDANGPELRFYPFQEAPPASLLTVLQSIAPKAQVTIDRTANRLAVVATPVDHAAVKETIEQYAGAPNAAEKRQLVLYPVSPAQRKRFQLLLADLQADLPGVKVLTDAEPGELAIWARPSEHKVIADIVERIKLEPPAGEVHRLVAYSIKTADPTSLLTVLQSMFPATKLVLDLKNRRLVAWTRPAEQESIKTLIEQMDSETPSESKNQLMVYPVMGIDPTAAITTLKSLVPDATLTSDTKASTIVAWARKSDQALIGPALERMRPQGDPEHRPHVVAYPTGNSDPITLAPVISTLVPTARVVANPKAGTLAVWATPDEHQSIRKAIEEITAKRGEGSAYKSIVYTLKHVTAAMVLPSIQTVVPEARAAVGASMSKVVVWGRPADHEVVKTTLADLDQEEVPPDDGVVPRVHTVHNAEPSNMLATLQNLFVTRRDVRLSLDTKSNKIVAIATPAQHEAIAKVIEEVDRGAAVEVNSQLEMHPLKNAEADVVLQVLNSTINRRGGRVTLSIDPKSKQLIAVAPPEQQEKIRTIIERLQAAGRKLEVFQLEVLEPSTAQVAIDRLLGEGTAGSKTAGAPTIEADASAQRLYVRATNEQLTQIRELLIKMGESHLAVADGAGRGVRVIPFSGDTKAALAEIQRVWPQLSKSPLRIVGPSDPLERLLPKSPASTQKQAPVEPAAEPAAPKEPKESEPDQSKSEDKQTGVHRARYVVEVKTALQQEEPLSDDPAKEAQPPEKAPPATEAQQPPPIIVAPGDDKITIMSDDPEAIAQFESLLRTLSAPAGAGGREIIVHPLHTASSATVADILQKVFRRNTFDARDSIVIEADQRLNAVIVSAGRNDRAAIERLIKTLDSEDVPDSLAANRPHLIPVKNTNASRILVVLKDVYKTQLTSGGIKQQIPIPSGATRDVAALIQQINTASSGPLMTLGVDDATNSIVIMAPGPLVKEVDELVAELDESSLNDTSRSVQIVKLKSTSAVRVKEILDTIIKDAVRRKASGGSLGARP